MDCPSDRECEGNPAVCPWCKEHHAVKEAEELRARMAALESRVGAFEKHLQERVEALEKLTRELDDEVNERRKFSYV